MAIKSPLPSKNLTRSNNDHDNATMNPTCEQSPLKIKRKVRIDGAKNQVEEFTNNENGDEMKSCTCSSNHRGRKSRNTVLPVKAKHVTQIINEHGVLLCSFLKRVRIK